MTATLAEICAEMEIEIVDTSESAQIGRAHV